MLYHGRLGLTVRLIITPVVNAAYGIKSVFFLKNVKSKSKKMVKRTENIKTVRYRSPLCVCSAEK